MISPISANCGHSSVTCLADAHAESQAISHMEFGFAFQNKSGKFRNGHSNKLPGCPVCKA